MAGPRFLLGVGAALVLASSSALADPSAADRETSRDLYAQGVKALAASDFVGAERACGGAFKLVNAPSGALCWGRALEGLGKLVEARDAYLAAAHFPQKADEPPVFTFARTDAKAAADAVETRIPTLVFSVSGVSRDAPLRVAVDGAEIASDTARLPRKVNPGHHVVLVASKGYRTAHVEVTAAEGKEQRVDVQLQAAAADDSASAEGFGSDHSEARGSAVPAIVAFSVGGVGLIAGAIFAALGISSQHDADTACPGKNCPPGVDYGHYNSVIIGDTIGSVAGFGVAVAGAITGWLLLPSERANGSQTQQGLRVFPVLGPGVAAIIGRF